MAAAVEKSARAGRARSRHRGSGDDGLFPAGPERSTPLPRGTPAPGAAPPATGNPSRPAPRGGRDRSTARSTAARPTGSPTRRRPSGGRRAAGSGSRSRPAGSGWSRSRGPPTRPSPPRWGSWSRARRRGRDARGAPSRGAPPSTAVPRRSADGPAPDVRGGGGRRRGDHLRAPGTGAGGARRPAPGAPCVHGRDPFAKVLRGGGEGPRRG